MPIYEYLCDCENEREVMLPFSESDQPQVCACGKVMRRIISVPRPAIFTPTGKGMALDTLNSKSHQGGMPDRHWKKQAEQYAAAGL